MLGQSLGHGRQDRLGRLLVVLGLLLFILLLGFLFLAFLAILALSFIFHLWCILFHRLLLVLLGLCLGPSLLLLLRIFLKLL